LKTILLWKFIVLLIAASEIFAKKFDSNRKIEKANMMLPKTKGICFIKNLFFGFKILLYDLLQDTRIPPFNQAAG